MYVATNRIKVRNSNGTDLEELFQRRAGLEQQPGFLTFELWKMRGETEHEDYLVVSHWENEQAHSDWTKSEAFRQVHSGFRSDFILGPGEFHAYDVRVASRAGE